MKVETYAGIRYDMIVVTADDNEAIDPDVIEQARQLAFHFDATKARDEMVFSAIKPRAREIEQLFGKRE